MTKTAGLRIGRVVEGGKVHIATGAHCPILATRPIAITANPAKVDTKSVCRWCAKPANLAAAHRENTTGTNWSATVEKFLANLGPQSTLNPAGYNVEHDAERAQIAAQHAAFWAEPEAVAPVEVVKPSFASVLANLGGRHNGAHYDHAARRLTRRHLANAA